MPVIAAVVKCKKCGAGIRSDWKFCLIVAARPCALASIRPGLGSKRSPNG